MRDVLLGLTAFLASAVEMVEALTIILAVGLTRGWRTALTGTAAALVALAVVVAVLGPSVVKYVPIGALQVFVGALLLIFGLQWLRKAILRASGRKEKHDEEAAFKEEVARVETGAATSSLDGNGFGVSFKGVFLEGLEVAFIVLTFGANAGSFGPSVAGAVAAFVAVALIGVVVHRPLSRVPENAIKFSVGLALTTFGTFWGGEGVGIDWTLGDATLVVLLGFYGLMAALLVSWLKGARPRPVRTVAEGGAR